MGYSLFRLVITITGAFAIWAVKGFKGPFDTEMVSIKEGNSTKENIRFFIGFGIWVLIAILTAKLLTKTNEIKSYRLIEHQGQY